MDMDLNERLRQAADRIPMLAPPEMPAPTRRRVRRRRTVNAAVAAAVAAGMVAGAVAGSSAARNALPGHRSLIPAASSARSPNDQGATRVAGGAALPKGDAASLEPGLAAGHLATTSADEAVVTLVMKFMAFRVKDLNGAGDFLSGEAKQAYADHQGGLFLYSPDQSHHYLGFTIESVEGVGSGSYVVQVRITQVSPGANGSSASTALTEQFVVGLGPQSTAAGGGFVVESALRVG
jgi:hypothetical protein